MRGEKSGELRACGCALADHALYRLDILIVDVPSGFEDQRAERRRIRLSRAAQLCESLIRASGAQQQVAQIPTRVSVSGSQLDGAAQSLFASLRVAGSLARTPQLKPQAIVVRRKPDGLFIEPHGFRHPARIESPLFEIARDQIDERITRRKPHRTAGRLDSALVHVRRKGRQSVADVPARPAPRARHDERDRHD